MGRLCAIHASTPYSDNHALTVTKPTVDKTNSRQKPAVGKANSGQESALHNGSCIGEVSGWHPRNVDASHKVAISTNVVRIREKGTQV